MTNTNIEMATAIKNMKALTFIETSKKGFQVNITKGRMTIIRDNEKALEINYSQGILCDIEDAIEHKKVSIMAFDEDPIDKIQEIWGLSIPDYMALCDVLSTAAWKVTNAA